MTGNEDDAREMTQDVFVRVHANAARYETRGVFKSWLFRIAGNRARSFARRRKLVGWVRFDVVRHDRRQDAPGPDAGLLAGETKDRVRAAVAALPERQRRALVLRRFHEMSQKEIAAAMEISEGAVESLLTRAMSALRGRLSREMEETP